MEIYGNIVHFEKEGKARKVLEFPFSFYKDRVYKKVFFSGFGIEEVGEGKGKITFSKDVKVNFVNKKNIVVFPDEKGFYFHLLDTGLNVRYYIYCTGDYHILEGECRRYGSRTWFKRIALFTRGEGYLYFIDNKFERYSFSDRKKETLCEYIGTLDLPYVAAPMGEERRYLVLRSDEGKNVVFIKKVEGKYKVSFIKEDVSSKYGFDIHTSAFSLAREIDNLEVDCLRKSRAFERLLKICDVIYLVEWTPTVGYRIWIFPDEKEIFYPERRVKEMVEFLGNGLK